MNEYRILHCLDGRFIINDESEDAPLITVVFHNQAAKLPDEIKMVLVRQMFEPAPGRTNWNERLVTLGLSVVLSALTWLALHWFIR